LSFGHGAKDNKEKTCLISQATLFPLTDPADKFFDLWMFQQCFNRVVVSPQFFFARNESVDGIVTFAADRNRRPHLFAREVFLKPAIAMTSARDQMVFGRTLFHRPSTELAGSDSVFSHILCQRPNRIYPKKSSIVSQMEKRIAMIKRCSILQPHQSESNMPLPLKPLSLSAVLAATVCLALLMQFSTVEAQQKKPKPKPKPTKYSLGKDSMQQPNVPQGVVTEHQLLESTIFPGTKRRYSVYVPAQYDASKPAALMVFQDGHTYASTNGDFRVPIVMDNLIHQQQIPVMIGVFVDPGHKKDALPEKRGWKPQPENRSFEYDTLSDDYVRFLIEELLPKVESEFSITQDPAGRGICGISSGGICAFTAAWQRPDQFSKVISHIGSFTNIRHGDTYPGIIRKTEPKPIRVYLQDGSNDLDNEHGNWPLGNQQMHKALMYKNYDHKFEYGDGAHNGNHGGAIFPDAMRWTWRDFPGVKPLPLSLRAATNSEPWALSWWQDRHEEKLQRKSKMKKVDVVLLGDSITHGWEKSGKPVFDKSFQGLNVLNLGFSGDRTEHVLWRLRHGAVEGISPKVVLMLIGTNNTGHRKEPAEETAAGIKGIIDELRARLPETKILVQAIFPRDQSPEGEYRKQNDTINAIVKDFADNQHVFYTDINKIFLKDDGQLPKSIMPDALHPNRKGYEKWAGAIMPKLKELMPK
jgi:enterochelin esterase family protein